jgi:hypothetical protein
MSNSGIYGNSAQSRHKLIHLDGGEDEFNENDVIRLKTLKASKIYATNLTIEPASSNLSIWTDTYNSTTIESAANRSNYGLLEINGMFLTFGGEIPPYTIGSVGTVSNKIYYSTDNTVTWTVYAGTTTWSARTEFVFFKYNGKLWLIGGWNGSSYYGEIWTSTNGFDWVLEKSDANLAVRSALFVKFNGLLWIIGGIRTAGTGKEIYTSSDGINWVLRTSSGFAISISGCQNIGIYNNQLIIASVGNNTFYKSSDGLTWTTRPYNNTVTVNAPIVTYNGELYLIGGYNSSTPTTITTIYKYDFTNDLWISWTDINHARTNHRVLRYENNVYVIGGRFIDSSSTAIGSIERTSNNINGSVSITSSTASSSTTTGALIVNGGIGSSGGINAGGNCSANGSLTANGGSLISTKTTNQLIIGNITINGISGPGRIITIPNAFQDCNILTNSIISPVISGNSRPSVSGGTNPQSYEIRAFSSTALSSDDGYLRIRAGGGTNGTSASCIDISGSSGTLDMDKNIVFFTGGTERGRFDSTGLNITQLGLPTGSFTSTLSGALTGTVPLVYQIIGNTVILKIGPINATATSTGGLNGTIPNVINPSAAIRLPFAIMINTTPTLCIIVITTGSFGISVGNGGNFISGQNIGSVGFNYYVTYMI